MSYLSSTRQPVYRKLAGAMLASLFAFHTGLASAGPLNIADNALEIATGVDPNIMILADDSGSMDSGIMSPEEEGILWLTSALYNWDYYYTHPAPGASGNAPSINANTFVVPDPVFLAANGVAAPQGGAWRAWNSDYNTIYYNPNEKYTPWKGVDVNGNPYTNIDPAAAPYNPYRPAEGNIDLTTPLSYISDCGATECVDADFISFTVTDFYPARYYTWTDSNGDGIVDADEPHTLVEITDARELVNFANWFSYYRKRDLTAKNAYSKVIEPATSARIGFATINDNAENDGIKVAPMNVSAFDGNKLALLNEVFSTQPGDGTPLREKLEEVGEYFACSSDNIFDLSADSPAEEPGDPSTANNCPVFKAPAGTCQQNYTIVMTDGFWNGSDEPDVGNADNDGSPGTSPGPFDGDSFADSYEKTLADVAMHYYERDLQTGLDNEVPTTTRDRNRYNGSTDPFETMHQHMATYTVGFGVDGTLSANPPNSEDTFAWPDAYNGDAEKIDDLRHAAWNGRGDFLSAGDPDELASSLDDIFTEIAAGTGAASSVAFNTQNLESGALVFRAFFDTNTNSGSLIAQNVSITGEISSSIRWDAAKKLDNKTGGSTDTREIVSFDATTNTGIPFKWTSLNGNDNDSTAVSQKGHLNLPIITGGDIATAPDPLGEDRLNYLRGQSGNEGGDASAGEFRPRPSTAGKLGDIIHSSPVFVGKPPFTRRDAAPFPTGTVADTYSAFITTYGSRRELVYIGANDGMLHSFDANTGEEVFAYVPNLLFPKLSALTDQDYSHQFFVDMSPAVNDVVITPADGTNQGKESWNSILVGGLGAGGAGYFALNVTDPADLDTEAEAADNVLWEFTPADDDNLGISIRQPLIAMSNIAGTKGNRWVAIFGNGYNSASTDGDAELYILFIDGGIDGTWTPGTDFIKISTGKGKAESSDGTTPNGLGSVRGIDVDSNGTVDAVYAGDLQGNLYRFDLSGSTTSSWSLPTGNPLFTATYGGGATPIQPITNRPIVTRNTDVGGYMVIVGTGSYFTTDDASSTAIQSIYGLWDDFTAPSDNVVSVDYSRLLEQTLANASNVNGFSVRTLTDYTISQWGTSGGAKKQGWRIDLDVESGGSVEFPGERAIRNFLLRGNYVFVNTVIPKSSAACTVGPGGFEYAFNPLYGGSGEDPAFDLNNDGDFDENDNVGATEGASNVVSGIRFDQSTPTDSSFIGNRKVTQTSDKSIRSIGTNTGTSAHVGRHSWREIEL